MAVALACALPLAATAAPAYRPDRFIVEYQAPADPAHHALYERMKGRRVLERFRDFLGFLRLPNVMTLRLAGCDGEDNAWYDSEDRSVTVCYEYLHRIERIAPKQTTPDGVTGEGVLVGATLEVFLHEVGHAVFDQLRIPILGREEDAADQFAAYILVHLGRTVARDTVLGVAWMYAHDARAARMDRRALSNVHSLDAQRFYNLLCIAYGAEPKTFQAVVDAKHLPADRAEGCEAEYQQVAWAMQRLFRRYVDQARLRQIADSRWLGQTLRRKLSGDR